MSRKNLINPFRLFLDEKQAEARSKGKYETKGKLMVVFKDVWMQLSEREKDVYVSKAKALKNNRKYKLEGVLSSKGVLVTDEMTLKIKAAEKRERRRLMVQSLVESRTSISDLLGASFFILSFNVMVKTKHRWLPLELGLVEYSIRDGIKNSYHKFIDAGPVPDGYMNRALRHSESHRIPIIDFALAEGRFNRQQTLGNMFLDILELVTEQSDEGQNRPRVVFTAQNMVPQVEGSLRFMAEQSKSELYCNLLEREGVVVLDLEWLLFFLAQASGHALPFAICGQRLSLSSFDYSLNSGCTYHETIDCKDCALGYSKKWCFMLSDALCPLFEISPTSAHLPDAQQTVIYSVPPEDH